MDLENLLALNRVDCNAKVGSKKRALQKTSELLASGSPGVSSETIFDGLLARERLGSTGVGNGVALPHARVAGVENKIGVGGYAVLVAE